MVDTNNDLLKKLVDPGSVDYFVGVGSGAFEGSQSTAVGGFSSALTAGVTEDIWCEDGEKEWLTSAEIINVFSSSADDTAAGSGARTLLLNGLDAAGSPISEVVTLNGITPVVTSNAYLFVSSAFLLTAGSGETNAGDISFQASVSASIQNCIPAGNGLTDSAHYQTPLGKQFLPLSFEFSATKVAGGQLPLVNFNIQARFRAPDSAWISILSRDLDTAVQNQLEIYNAVPISIQQGAQLRVQATSSENNTIARCRINGVAVDI